MIPVTDLHAGVTFQLDGTPYIVVKYSHVNMGRGNATIRVSCRNLRSGGVDEKTFNSGSTVEPITTLKRSLQYLYADNQNVAFMDPKTFEQVEIVKTILGEQISFLKKARQ